MSDMGHTVSTITLTYEAYKDDVEKQTHSPDLDNFDPVTYDAYIQAQIWLSYGEELQLHTILHQKWDNDSKAIRTYDNNLMLDTQVYEVMLDDIIDHKKDVTAVGPDDRYVLVNGRKCHSITTKGWMLCIQWKDGSTSW